MIISVSLLVSTQRVVIRGRGVIRINSENSRDSPWLEVFPVDTNRVPQVRVRL